MAYRLHSPDYYTRGSIEVKHFIRDQDLNFALGNAIKYICRAGHKGIDGRSMAYAYAQDLVKAITYLEDELAHVSPEQPSNRVPPSVQYTERLTEEEPPEIFDR